MSEWGMPKAISSILKEANATNIKTVSNDNAEIVSLAARFEWTRDSCSSQKFNLYLYQ